MRYAKLKKWIYFLHYSARRDVTINSSRFLNAEWFWTFAVILFSLGVLFFVSYWGSLLYFWLI